MTTLRSLDGKPASVGRHVVEVITGWHIGRPNPGMKR